MSAYAFLSAERLVCAYTGRGLSRLAEIDTRGKNLREIETPYTDISYVRASAETGRVVFRGGASALPASIVSIDPATGRAEVLRRSNDLRIDEGYFSNGEPVEFPTENDRTAHVLLAPRNRIRAPLKRSAGAPRPQPRRADRRRRHRLTSDYTDERASPYRRDYGGSTGYGRAYRQDSTGRGDLDVDDCVNGARHLVARGLADPARSAIAGGSAGGYTTLCALTFRDQFKAGASYYGVSDLGALVRETHKFESRYLDRLVGPYPEREDVYRARSPINFTDQLSARDLFQDRRRFVPPTRRR